MSRAALLAEVAIAYALIEASLWTELPWRLVWWYAAAAWVLVTTVLRRRSLPRLGLSAAGLARAAWVAAAGAALAALIVSAAHWAGTLHDVYPAHPWRSLLAYSLWALAQQFLLQSFFFVRIELLLGDPRKAVVVTALLFGFAHLPSPVLAPLTLAGGLVFCELFRRYRNLYPLAVAHALLGLALAVSVPNTVQHNMRVGIGYLDWHPRAVRMR